MNAMSRPSGEAARPGVSCSDANRYTTRSSPPALSDAGEPGAEGPSRASVEITCRPGPSLLITTMCALSASHSAWLTSASSRLKRELHRFPGHRAGLLIDAGDEHHRPVRRLAGAVEQQPLAVRRPARPADLGAAAEKTDSARRRAAGRGPQPDVVGLILVRVERDPLAVRRPAQRLILGRRCVHHARWLRRRIRRIDGDDPGVLRDVGILRIVHDAAPRAVGDAEESARRIPRRRLALKGGERAAGSAVGRDQRHERCGSSEP